MKKKRKKKRMSADAYCMIIAGIVDGAALILVILLWLKYVEMVI